MRVIAVCSGKGGVGKSNIVVNLGILYAQKKKTILFDADLGLSNLNILLNCYPPFNLFHVIKKEKKLVDVIWKTQYGVSVISGGSGLVDLIESKSNDRDYLINELIQTLNNYDVLIIDTPAGASSRVINFLQSSDDILVITNPEPTAMADAYAVIKMINIKFENPIIHLIINKSDSVNQALMVSTNLINVCKRFLSSMNIDCIGFLYNDKHVEISVLEKTPYVIKYPHAKNTACLKHIFDKIELSPAPTRGRGFKFF